MPRIIYFALDVRHYGWLAAILIACETRLSDQ
jgi:hypothetical protein